MTTYYVHSRAGGFRQWVAVATAETQKQARAEIKRLQAQDDPMWADADYLISESLKPRDDEKPTVAKPIALTQERAQEAWSKRGIQNAVDHALSAGEIAYVAKVWDTLPDHTSWMSAFYLILNGKDPLLSDPK